MASSTVKRQRKRKRIDTDGDPEFQVAPMVDVLLVLMLFFMSITSTEVLQKNKNLQLADAKNAKPQEKGKPKTNEIVVNIAWDAVNSVAQFSMDGIDYPTADSMQGILAGKHAQNPAGYVLVRADKDVQYSNVADLMNTCAAAGVGTVTFAVITGGGKKKAPAPDAGGSASN